MTRNIFHLGYPKCASTSLQLDLFAVSTTHRLISRVIQNNSSGFSSRKLSPSYFESEELIKDFHNDILSGNAVSVSAVREVILKYSPFIYSDEFFLDSRFCKTSLIERIKALSPIVQKGDIILIVMRDPLEILRSMYRDHPFSFLDDDSGYVSFDEFIMEASQDSNFEIFDLDYVVSLLKKFIPGSQLVVINFDDEFFKKVSRTALADELGTLAFETFKGAPKRNEGNTSVQYFYRIMKRYVRFFRMILGERLSFSIDNRLKEFFARFGSKKTIFVSKEAEREFLKRLEGLRRSEKKH